MNFIFSQIVLFNLIFSFNKIQSEICLSSNLSYAICSTTGGIQSKYFSKTALINECDGHFLEKILSTQCNNHESILKTTTNKQKTSPTTAERYGYGFLAVFIVSALSLAGLLALPILYKVSFQYVLTLFTALAVGTLFGDTMFHLIPFALGLHGDHHHDGHNHESFSVPNYIWKMLISVLVVYGFYLLEVILHSFAHYKHKTGSSVHFHAHGHGHTVAHHKHSHPDGEICEHTPIDIDADLEHSHRLHNHLHHNLHQHVSNEISTASTVSIAANQNCTNKKNSTCVPCAYSNDHQANNSLLGPTLIDDNDNSTPISIVIKKKETKSTKAFVEQLKTIKSTGWMVLIGDGIHNFADGLAIGAAFSQDTVLGITTTLAVCFHELPHELGDYAVLIQSGFSHCRALLWNFLSATTAFIGFFLSAILSNDENIRQWIFAVTIGMFLYIALVDLLPTLLADGQVEFKRFLVVNIGFLLGIGIMFLLALVEDSLIHLLPE